MSEAVEPGMVLYDWERNRKYVALRARPLGASEEVAGLYPHEDGDYSYRCHDRECRCQSQAGTCSAPVAALETPRGPSRSPRDMAVRLMAEKVRNITGCRLIDCRQAVTKTNSVPDAVKFLATRPYVTISGSGGPAPY